MAVKDKGKSSRRSVSEADYGFAVNLMQFLVVPAFVLDVEGKVLIWNKACERLTGLPASEVVGTREHWRGFYDAPRPCLADLLAQDRVSEIDALYAAHDDSSGGAFGLHAENWCMMPRLGTELYLAIDAGPIYDEDGKLLAVIETLRDMSVQKKAQAELERLATYDGLTGIVNRRGFDARLQSEWSRASREHTPLSLLMIDVDHFKRYNDTYGHQMGDECLKKIAKSLSRAAFRPSDLIARYGGEEFAIVLPAIDEEGARVVAARIRDVVATLGITHSGGEGGIVTVSIGVSSLSPDDKMKPEELIALADRALYQAKRIGRDCIVSQDWIS
jgi:diguanylate cyclase (GGDEF)-like protein